MSSTFENEKEFSEVVVPTILEFVHKNRDLWYFSYFKNRFTKFGF
ncbi:hypothetical protein LEP1GSC055_0398 [Leptospira borgpetersenii str. Brem 307]|uniref:Uncharacterized protein n=1 Tax=Leptospira borgpetersenii str. Brem 328 TaxID=1049780 RepID=A0ABC9SJP8_LEPBO|nr:hypothetical protein LEP1GSC055_0398 [Leptospira borgpetersenii str. Brem 307]EMN17966.1 hypothetical protein LEP1GSC056_0495 [Leptospira borgpetersenii str. Brem 328]